MSIIVHSIHLGSQLSLQMTTLGNCLLRNVWSLILRCLDLKEVKQQICCWLNLHFFSPPVPPITSLLSSLLSLWCPDYIRPVLRNPPHVGSFSSLAAFFCVNTSFFDQVLFSLTVYRDFILCESVFFCPFQRNYVKM